MFLKNKKVLRAQSIVWHFVRHPVCTLLGQNSSNIYLITNRPLWNTAYIQCLKWWTVH